MGACTKTNKYICRFEHPQNKEVMTERVVAFIIIVPFIVFSMLIGSTLACYLYFILCGAT